MFLKPFKVKTNTQLKGSERKKIRLEIQKSFPELSDEDLQQILPPKDPITCMKLWTSSNEQAMVYCTPSIPVVFEVEKVMYPTVYFLWQFPHLLYTFTTWPPVLSKLTSGADLMLPGVIVDDPFTIKSFGKMEKGTRVAVNLSTNKAPVAVGKTALSSMDMYMSAKRGKGVHILHTIGDHLWFHSQRPPVPELGPPEVLSKACTMESTCEEQTESGDEEEEEHTETASDGSEGEGENQEEDESIPEAELQILTLNDDETEQPEEQNATEENPQTVMDQLLRYCFLKAWRSPSAKKIALPLLTSNFFRLHMLPACPANQSLDVKKSSYKKLSAFLAAMAQEQIIKVREQVKGVESIVEVNSSHTAIRSFELDQEDIPEAKEEALQKDAKTSPNIVELYKITAHVLPIFKTTKYKKGDALTVQLVRQYITEYVRANNLQDPDNPRLVILDANFQDMLSSKYGSDILKLSWEELFQKTLSVMSMTYHLTATGLTPAAPAKGKLEPIDIRVSTRSGNKKVTLINNLELFGVVCQDFARKCQHGVAASTSISAVPGKKSAQVLVQGNQVDFVGKLLLNEYKIPVRYIRGLENAPAKKKSKAKK
ncbi:hypothetical protein B566_EDAN009721 [Ephemera danica]|nr:hypothetical protein B566_EDAN009721 [Ephemera danica]